MKKNARHVPIIILTVFPQKEKDTSGIIKTFFRPLIPAPFQPSHTIPNTGGFW